MFKRRAGLNGFGLNGFGLLAIIITKELKNKSVLNLKQYFMHCRVVLRNVIYNCGILFIVSFPVESCSFLFVFGTV